MRPQFDIFIDIFWTLLCLRASFEYKQTKFRNHNLNLGDYKIWWLSANKSINDKKLLRSHEYIRLPSQNDMFFYHSNPNISNIHCLFKLVIIIVLIFQYLIEFFIIFNIFDDFKIFRYFTHFLFYIGVLYDILQLSCEERRNSRGSVRINQSHWLYLFWIQKWMINVWVFESNGWKLAWKKWIKINRFGYRHFS